MSSKDFMSISEVQEALGISRGKAYELASSQGFPSVRLGRRIVVPVKQFEAWIEEQASANK